MQQTIHEILTQAKNAMLARDYASAQRVLSEYLSKDPTNKATLELLGNVYVRDRQYASAEKTYLQILDSFPMDVSALNNLGQIYRYMKHYDQSIEVLNKALKLKDGNQAETYYNLGTTYVEIDALEPAEDCFMMAVERNPSDVLAYNHLGRIRYQIGNKEKAIEAYKQGLTVDPNHPILHYNMGECLESMNKPAEALNEYRIALKTKPGWLDALKKSAQICTKMNNIEAALNEWQKVLVHSPENIDAYTAIGELYVRVKNVDKAFEYYGKAISKNNMHLPAILKLESLLEEQEQYGRAQDELLKILKKIPDNKELNLRLAQLYVRREQYPEAKTLLLSLLKRDNHDTNALEALAKLYVKQDNFEQAQKCLKKLLDIDPSKISVIPDLVAILIKLENYTEAEQCLLSYLKERPNDITAYNQLGKIYELDNKLELAQKAYSQMLFIDASNSQALEAIARLYNDKGQPADAIQVADELINLQGARGDEDDLSKLNKSLELYEDAINQFHADDPSDLEKNLSKLRTMFQEDAEMEESDEPITASLDDTEEIILPTVQDEDNEELQVVDDDVDLMSLVEEDDPFEISSPDELDKILEETSPDTDLEMLGDSSSQPRDMQYEPDFLEENDEDIYTDLLPSSPHTTEKEADTPIAMPERSAIQPLFEELQQAQNILPVQAQTPQKKSSVSETIEENSLLPIKENVVTSNRVEDFSDTDTVTPEDSLIYDSPKLSDNEKIISMPQKQRQPANDQSKPKILNELNTSADQLTDQVKPRAEIADTESEDLEDVGNNENSTATENLEQFSSDQSEQKDDTTSTSTVNQMIDAQSYMHSPTTEFSLVSENQKMVLDLMLFLKDLVAALDPVKRAEFLVSKERMRMEYIIERLSGNNGIFKRIMQSFLTVSEVKTAEPDINHVTATLDYMRQLTSNIGDSYIAQSLNQQVSEVIEKIREE